MFQVEVAYSANSLNISLKNLTIFMVKLAVASIPAIVVFYIVVSIIVTIIGGTLFSIMAALSKLSGS